MTTISNNKLPEWRKTLNKSVENYQSMRAWYEENPDNPSAEQDMDAAEGDIEKLLKQYGVLIVLSLMDEIDELQELRKADSAPPAQIVSIPDDWQTCEKLSDDSYVDNALRELVEDTTGDNGVRVVQAVIRALRDSGLIRTYPDLSQPVDPQISEYEKIMGQAGNSPVTPDDWIPVSERMPPQGVPLLVCSGNGVVQRTVYGFDGENWLDWYEQYDPVKAELDDLWQPLPAPPQK
ncbi:DUF551 domain-containing protein [Salmonella enterica]|nr:DUF551 domain-containing protein [Salmonella enterica]